MIPFSDEPSNAFIYLIAFVLQNLTIEAPAELVLFVLLSFFL